MVRKLLTSLLALSMILSLMPFTALAMDEPEARYSTDLSGGTEEGSFAEAIANVCDGGTVTLLRDVEASGSIHISGKIITLLGEGNKIVLSPTGIVINTNAVLYLGQPGYDKALTICSSGTTYALFNLQDSAKMYMYSNVTLGPAISQGTVGGVHLSDRSQFTMYGGTITDCHSKLSISGAVAITDNSTFHMVDGLIENCTGQTGGAINLHPGPAIGPESEGIATFQMEGGTIKNCSSIGNYGGGAIFANTGKQPLQLHITGGRIENCSASNQLSGYGGAISIWSNNEYDNDIFISGLTLSHNTATQCGGAILCSVPDATISNIVIENNTAGIDGGGIYLNKGTLTCTGLTLTGNTATAGSGGGIFLGGGELDLGDDARITDNKASAGSGGGIYRSAGVSLSVGDGGLIQGNTAKSGGGIAIHNNSSSFILSEGLSIYDNTATAEGDDIYFEGTGLFFPPSAPKGEPLSCGHLVDGWYYDTASSRWGTGSCGHLGGIIDPQDPYGWRDPVSSGAALKAAHGEIKQHTITVTTSGEGSVSPAGPEVTVNHGDDQHFTITPEEGHYIHDVLVNGESIGQVDHHTFEDVSASHIFHVVFEPITYTIIATGEDGGTISPSGTTSVPHGGSQSYTITPDPGFSLQDVLVNGVSVGPVSSYTFDNVTASQTIHAVFAPITYTITATVEGGGAISPSGTTSVPHGGSQSYTITPDPGYFLQDVLVNGVSVGPVSSYTFDNVTANQTIHAVFAWNGGDISVGYIIDATAGEGGSISPSGRVSVPAGGSQSFAITAEPGWQIADVLVDGVSIGAVSSYTFTNVRQNHTISVVFIRAEEATGVSDWLNMKDHMDYLHGYEDNTFRPDNHMIRAEAAQMFYNLLLDKDVSLTVSFSDVPANAWYAQAVNTLASLGIITGVGDDLYEPDRAITRAEFTVIAMRFGKLPAGGQNIFSDVSADDWFYDQVVGAIQYGWISGYRDGTFRPDHTITRAEVATIVNRMLNRSADEAYVNVHEKELVQFSDLKPSYWAYYDIMESANSHIYQRDDVHEVWIRHLPSAAPSAGLAA